MKLHFFGGRGFTPVLQRNQRSSAVSRSVPSRHTWGALGFSSVAALSIAFLASSLHAEVSSPTPSDELPIPMCSPLKPISPELKKYNLCEITALPVTACNKVPTQPERECHQIKVNLTVNTGEFENTGEIKVGGYKVKTEHYNDSYLTPVIEALPGDTVAAHLVNKLPNRTTDCMTDQGATDRNPTNLHYFHGGIVSPNNARPEVVDARQGTGDNIYVYLKNGADSKPFDLDVPIPGIEGLDARVLESKDPDGKISRGKISHPVGLNWYHSHLHCLSSDQVMGGMSGLLSVGEDMANVKAKCAQDTPADQCNNLTDELKKRTIVKYAMLRDVTLTHINASPTESTEPKTATWAPEQERTLFDGVCSPKPELREGFCQRDPKSVWLFTLNGQRFPTITIENGKNLLLRLGNLSSNVAYWLELDKVVKNGSTEELKLVPLTILSLDGVVPARPQHPEGAKPVDAVAKNDLLLMPASRVEIYIRNDQEEHLSEEWNYVLRTKALNTGGDKWPEIRLAHIRLQPTRPAPRPIPLALNVPVVRVESLSTGEMFVNALQSMPSPLNKLFLPTEPGRPDGCTRDLKSQEHRRVTFYGGNPKPRPPFAVRTQIVKEPDQAGDYYDNNGNFSGEFKVVSDETVDASFEDYELEDGKIDWDGKKNNWDGKKNKHVCVRLDNKENYKQLWVIHNDTNLLHNFHIHQMKFRLAKKEDLEFHHINVPKQSSTCESNSNCNEPEYQLYDANPDPKLEWHDTIPVPPAGKGDVFLIMSFVDEKQRGRFVYHCHILKHEDKGLMAPIEVWGP